MKKNLFLVSALALALIFLSACGSSKTNDEQPDSDGTTVSDEDTTEPADTGTTEPDGDTGTTEPDGDTGEPETDGDTTEPETDGDTTEPETDGDTTEPETDGDTTEPETDGDTTEPETDGDTTEPETDGEAGTDEEPGTDEDSVEPETDSDSAINPPDEDIPSLGCMTNSDCNAGEICSSHNICVEADPCDGVTCGNGGVCTVETAAAYCNCTSGYYNNNASCAEITGDSVAGWVGIQWPATITKDLNADADKVYGQIYVSGKTEYESHMPPTTCPDGWKAQLGYKAGTGAAEYPVIASNWTWIDAEFNTLHNSGEGEKDNNFEFMADFPTNVAGSFIYIFRFSLDNGASWWYADAAPAIITSASNTPGQATIN